ncbi:hypothetical protein [Aquincola tertiaricarbonis]|uniref:hypothetical protein n=1 Tax=Aquincola tertiaricarbonis TaxID=391953 RepID=UPI000614EC69|nr:hypothetical protein [Aquincola tertiaricarbonis]
MTIQLSLPIHPDGPPVLLTVPSILADTGSIYACPAVASDADVLQLRHEDAAASSLDWREKVFDAIEAHGGASFRDSSGHLLGIFGLTSGPGYALPWLLCDVIPAPLQRPVLRISHAVADQLSALADAGVLVANQVPRDSAENRRFIEALGFSINTAPTSTGPDLFHFKRHV